MTCCIKRDKNARYRDFFLPSHTWHTLRNHGWALWVRLNPARGHDNALTTRQVAKLVGKLISIMKVLPRGKPFLRPLECNKLEALYNSHWNWDSPCLLSHDRELCLLWWCQNIPSTCTKTNHTILQTDSSNCDLGSIFNGLTAQGNGRPYFWKTFEYEYKRNTDHSV